jgi:hypothetical protein
MRILIASALSIAMFGCGDKTSSNEKLIHEMMVPILNQTELDEATKKKFSAIADIENCEATVATAAENFFKNKDNEKLLTTPQGKTTWTQNASLTDEIRKKNHEVLAKTICEGAKRLKNGNSEDESNANKGNKQQQSQQSSSKKGGSKGANTK